MTDDAWDGLKQMAYDHGYVRGPERDARPRGMSAFIQMLAMRKYRDNRPEYMRGTGQWITGTQKTRQRCLELSPAALADLGLLALEHVIYPYRAQLVVANGYRREAALPRLHAQGATPRGSTSILALSGPVLDAIGLGYLAPVVPLQNAPPNLYQGPRRRRPGHQSQQETTLM